ncbi:MAG: sulfotransferase [Caulobacteraceae bacterium]|nr:sulfotransferase [Caulobacteraceae bacterium]
MGAVNQVELDRAVGRLGALASACDELSRLPPMGPQFLLRVARAYTLLGAHDRAVPFLQRAVEAAPSDVNNQYSLGAAYVFTGQFDAARRHLKEAVRLQPRHWMAWYSLVDIDRQTPESNYIPQLEALFAPPDEEGSRHIHIGHALAKTYEDLGDYETSFDWLVKGKAARRARAEYADADEDALFAAAPATLAGGKGKGHPSQAPIFIGGMPRSGTTLVEAILSAHPDVTAGGELGIAPALVKHVSGGSDRHLLDPANMREIAEADMGLLGRAYIDATRTVAGATPHFTDKTPIDILYAGALHRALPNARFICVRRDPMDSVISFFRTMFVTTPHVYPSVYDLETAARHYVRFHRLADHWREAMPADRYREVRYEALVADQEGQTRALLDFVGLPFHFATLSFHDRPNVVSTASAVQVRKPMYKTALGRWKRYGERLAPAVKILRDAGIAVD